SDNGYLIAGTSLSNISGTKTEANYPGSGSQSWVIKTDSLGNYQWDKTALAGGWCDEGYAVQTSDGCYVIANSTFADAGGDKT
ncbi:hypothetical protein, partial [Salmonella sp. SAL4431]|uniref:hypothetical protein n=1 Tax=Salmonella sp. SAL4431 TaxID=3159886 RepID=UPI00397D7D97